MGAVLADAFKQLLANIQAYRRWPTPRWPNVADRTALFPGHAGPDGRYRGGVAANRADFRFFIGAVMVCRPVRNSRYWPSGRYPGNRALAAGAGTRTDADADFVAGRCFLGIASGARIRMVGPNSGRERAMGTDPSRKLSHSCRVLAGILMLPLLTALNDLGACAGGNRGFVSFAALNAVDSGRGP